MRISYAGSSNPPLSESPDTLVLPVPTLGNLNAEPLYPGKASSSLQHISVSIPLKPLADLAANTRKCYREIFHKFHGLHLYRIWTFIPGINEGNGDRENYRQYCLGRAEAYDELPQDDPEKTMAAGTCVGCEGDFLHIIAIAGAEKPSHHENPNQLPAYRYPREYGPRSPSFARATVIADADTRYRFISGTAAVLGHESIGGGDLPTQLKTTCDNLDVIIARTLEAEPTAKSTQATGKAYIRHAEDFTACRDYLSQRFPDWADSIVYLQSDICRQELLLEVEFTFADLL